MPSKSKKRKTSHHYPSQNQKHRNHDELSQTEIWDDSALVRSWEDAVKEYEYYHSLAARGIDPEEVLDQAEEAERTGEEVYLKLDGGGKGVEGGVDGGGRDVRGPEGEVEEGELEDGEVDEGPIEEELAGLEGQALTNGVTTKNNKVHGERHGPSLPPSRGAEDGQMPPADAATTHVPAPVNGASSMSPDQTLDNLKMAYYWAGYYSGLYDGQR